MEVTLRINKESVFDEVAMTAEYTGAKMADETAYERISLTDENREILNQFWSESKTLICSHLKRMFISEEDTKDSYTLSLELSESFGSQLTKNLESSLHYFFVANIISKWYALTNKEEAAGYATAAASYIEDIMRKAYSKEKPSRPSF
jgi:hypothetical protein